MPERTLLEHLHAADDAEAIEHVKALVNVYIAAADVGRLRPEAHENPELYLSALDRLEAMRRACAWLAGARG